MNILKENLLRKIIRNEIKSILNENEQPLTEMASRYIVTDPEGFEEKYNELKGKFKEGSTMRTILDKLKDEGEVDYNKLKVELNKSDIASFNNPNTRKFLEDPGAAFEPFVKPQGKAREKSAGGTSKSSGKMSNEHVAQMILNTPGLSAKQRADLLKQMGLGNSEETPAVSEAEEIKEFLQFKKWKNRLK